MKIVAIRGKNLASLEGEFEMDFTAEPLRSAGIFAITGTTGSGKSTLLDALCLALFDETPRTNRASENIQIVDLKDRTINQRDSRTILRRGTSDGYAEVDFISLSGEKFRSRWSVRRSRDRVDGSLQNSNFKVTNLTTNREEQGGKTELLAKVAQLIGLTFDQFTRAVLLAQGDFATFLKATQKEKAELLEKLTGTDIYSRISTLIFEKSKSAEHQLKTLNERISDIELLSEEEIELLSIEKKAIANEVLVLNKDIERLTNKIKWIADESTLNSSIKEAEELLSDTQKAIEEAKPRYDYLMRFDSVQEIRDDFNALKSSDQHLTGSKKQLAEEEKSLNANALLLQQADEKIAACEENLRRHNEIFQHIEPQIRQARALDVQLLGANNIVTETEKEYRQAKNREAEVEKSVSLTEASIRSAEKTVLKTDSWFEQYGPYKEIIPRVDLIINLLDSADTAIKQRSANEKIVADSKELVDIDSATLAELTKEAERLNHLLPSEIVSLRAKLEVGKPCPVCGSTHHPASEIAGESLKEAELNRAKRDVATKIETLNTRIGQRKDENIRLLSLIENYTKQSDEAFDKLTTYLAVLPEWKTIFEEGNLQNSLKKLTSLWTENERSKSKANEQIATLQTTLQLEKRQLTDTVSAKSEKGKRYSDAKASLEELRQKRTELLDGKNADETEGLYLRKGKELTDTLARLKEEKSIITASNDRLTGIIRQIHQEITRLSELTTSLRKRVDDWLLSKNGTISEEELSELVTKSSNWLIEEREQLNRLHQHKTSALATLAERKMALERHYLQENRPTKEETKDILHEILIQKKESVRQKTGRNAEIEILFVNQKRGKERIQQFEKELNEKSILSENWKKLNDMFGSADGSKFKVLAQGYTLDVLLSYANKQLKELSRRYEIQRIPDTLALQVIDLDMLGEIRTVHSLSGGESFLISLALALGLSSLSSNRMKIESLFIDEGFGSLDIDTLRVAMDALENLQTQGRKIGVISHVSEMTERIGTQIHVEKMANGRSRIEIKSI